MSGPVLQATEELDCCGCGLSIHIGDDIVLGQWGWLHPVCGELEEAERSLDIKAEREVDRLREERPCP